MFECTLNNACLTEAQQGHLETRRQGSDFGLATMTIHVRIVGMAAAWRSLRDPNSC